MKRKLLLFFIWVLAVSQSTAQDFDDDAALWMNVYVEKKLNKHFAAHLKQQNRVGENFTLWKMSYLDGGITYKFNKNWSFMGDYVFSRNRKEDLSFRSRHQAYVALLYRFEIRRWRFTYRNLFQAQMQEIYSSEKGTLPTYYERNKLTVKYELTKRITAYTAEEIYYPLYQAKNKGFDRSRTFLGTEYLLNRNMKLDLYFLYQHELNAFNATRRIFVYGIGYSYEF